MTSEKKPTGASPTPQQDKSKDESELVSGEEEQRNYKGICIALIVIATVCSLIITAVVLLSPGEEEPRVKNPRFELEEVIRGNYEPRSFNGSWLSDHELEFRDQDGALVVFDVREKTKQTMMPNNTFRQMNVQAYRLSPDKKYVLLITDIEPVFTYSFLANYKIFRTKNEHINPLLPDVSSKLQYVSWGPKGSQLVYVLDNNIYYMADYGSGAKPKRLTQNGEPSVIFNGIPDWTYEEEILHSNNAIWWLEDGSKLCFASFNDSMVDVMKYPSYGSYRDSTNAYPEIVNLRYPKAGYPIPHVTLWIVDLKATYLAPIQVHPPIEYKDREKYMTGVTWIDSDSLAVLWLSRFQNSSVVSICHSSNDWVCQKHIQLNNHDSAWVDLNGPPLFSQNKQNYFLKMPSADGKTGTFRHVAQYNLKTDRGIFLTHGPYDVTQIVAHHQEKQLVYYISTLEGKPGERHLFSVTEALTQKSPVRKECITCNAEVADKDGADKQVNDKNGEKQKSCLFANAIFSPDSRYFVLECLGPDVPWVELWDTENNATKVLSLDTNSELQEMLDNRALPQVRTFQVPLKGNYKANVRLLLPPGLRDNEIIRYPMVLNAYGYPGKQLVNEEFHIHWGTYLASQKKYIYAYIDGRGSGFQGDKRVQEIHRRLGTVEVEDQIAVASYLKSNLAFIDTEHMAIWGWSYGGYMTASVLASDKDVFQCGISVAPVTSLLYYDSVFSERYMNSPKPEDNYIGYEKADVMPKVENFRGKKFFLIHGTADDGVHLQHSMMLMKALTNAGILFRVQLYPDEKNSLRNVRMHLFQSMEDFLENSCFKTYEENPKKKSSR